MSYYFSLNDGKIILFEDKSHPENKWSNRTEPAGQNNLWNDCHEIASANIQKLITDFYNDFKKICENSDWPIKSGNSNYMFLYQGKEVTSYGKDVTDTFDIVIKETPPEHHLYKEFNKVPFLRLKALSFEKDYRFNEIEKAARIINASSSTNNFRSHELISDALRIQPLTVVPVLNYESKYLSLIKVDDLLDIFIFAPVYLMTINNVFYSVCQNCGKLFVPISRGNSNSLFCTNECHNEWTNARAHKELRSYKIWHTLSVTLDRAVKNYTGNSINELQALRKEWHSICRDRLNQMQYQETDNSAHQSVKAPNEEDYIVFEISLIQVAYELADDYGIKADSLNLSKKRKKLEDKLAEYGWNEIDSSSLFNHE